MSSATTPSVLARRKFAVLALPELRVGGSPRPLIVLDDRFAVSNALPDGALRTWEAQLGTIHRSELDECRLFLWALRPSKAPEILDGENEVLRRQVYQLYLGLMLSVPYFHHGRMTSLTGAATDAATVRSLTWYSPTFYTVGSPLAPLTTERIRDAHVIARALIAHPRTPSNRMVRALRTFRQATESPELDIRLHQFVRVIEAFLDPDDARSFGRRFAYLNGGRGELAMRECYETRSAIEHLRGPFDRMPSKPSGGKHRRLVRRAIEAETVARFLLFTYFTTRSLWPSLASRAAVKGLWSRSARELVVAIGQGIPMTQIPRAINWEELSRNPKR